MTGPEHIAAVRRLDCVLCRHLDKKQERPTSAHHIRTGMGMAQRAGDYCVVALCYECQLGPLGIHGDRTLLQIGKVNEMDLLDMTIEAIVSSKVWDFDEILSSG